MYLRHRCVSLHTWPHNVIVIALTTWLTVWVTGQRYATMSQTTSDIHHKINQVFSNYLACFERHVMTREQGYGIDIKITQTRMGWSSPYLSTCYLHILKHDAHECNMRSKFREPVTTFFVCTLSSWNSIVVHLIYILCCGALCTFYSPDPSMTFENVMKVMEKVTDGPHMEVWEWCLGSSISKEIKSKCSTEKELIHTCSDVYVHCYHDSSWEDLARGLYRNEETAAVEEVRAYLNPKG